MNDPLLCYHDSPIRKNWDAPSAAEIAASLKKAHAVNRRLVDTVNELYDAKKAAKAEMEALRSELTTSRRKSEILTSIFSSAITSALIGGLLAIAKAFAHR